MEEEQWEMKAEMAPPRWYIGVLIVAAIGAAGIAAQMTLFRKAVSLEADKDAWRLAVEERQEDETRLAEEIARRRDVIQDILGKTALAETALTAKKGEESEATVELDSTKKALDSTKTNLQAAKASLDQARAELQQALSDRESIKRTRAELQRDQRQL